MAVTSTSGDKLATIADHARGLEINPDDALAHNHLAWISATAPEDELRNGRQAVEHARRACELSGWKVAGFLDTLAASYAECGEFEEAIRYQQQAAGLAPETDRPDYEKRLELYRAGKPFRDE